MHNIFGNYSLLKEVIIIMRTIKFILFFGIIFISLSSSQGQEQISEKEILAEQLFIQAESYRTLGKTETALETYAEIRKKDPRNIAVLYGIARCYWDLSEWDQSERTITDALRFEPENPWLLDFSLKLFEERTKYKEAVPVAEKLFEVTGDPIYIDQKAFYLASSGQYAESYKELNRLETMVGTTKDIILTKMELLKSQNKSDEAVEIVKTGLNTFKNDTELMHEIAMVYVEKGETKKSLEWYEKILEVDNQDAQANIILSKARAGNAGNDKLISLISIVENPDISIDMKIAEMLPYLDKLLDDKSPLLIRDLDSLSSTLVQVHPSDPKAHSMRGDILYHSGKLVKSIISYKKTIDLSPSNFQIWRQLMHAQLFTADYDGLLSVSNEALNFYPNQALVYYYNANALYHLGKNKEALSIVNEGQFMTGSDKELKASLIFLKGKIQYSLIQNDNADQSFKEASELNPGATEIRSNYAVFLVKSGLKPDKNTLNFLNKEAQANPMVALDLAEILILEKDYKKAESVLTAAVQEFKYTYPLTLERLGDVKDLLNEKAEAIELWQEALLLMPHNSKLKAKIKA